MPQTIPPPPLPYEILLRGDAGVFRGGHTIAVPGGPALALSAASWPPVCASINQAALALVEQQAAKIAESDAVLTEMSAARDALASELVQNQSVSDQIAQVADDLLSDVKTTDGQKVAALRLLIPQARLYGQAREAARKLAEAEVLEKQAAELKAQAAAILPDSSSAPHS